MRAGEERVPEITFIFCRYIRRLDSQKKKAVLLQVLGDGKAIDTVWMSQADLKRNLAKYPDDAGLLLGLKAYRVKRTVADDCEEGQ